MTDVGETEVRRTTAYGLSILLATAGNPARADWFGRGVVVVRVVDSRSDHGSVVFRATVVRQEITEGPALAGRCTFSYKGSPAFTPSRGDLVRLRVSQGDGPITVERLERVTASDLLWDDLQRWAGDRTAALAIFGVITTFHVGLAVVARKTTRKTSVRSPGANR